MTPVSEAGPAGGRQMRALKGLSARAGRATPKAGRRRSAARSGSTHSVARSRLALLLAAAAAACLGGPRLPSPGIWQLPGNDALL